MLAAFGGGALLGTIAAGQVGRLRRPVIVGSLAFLAEAACIAVAPYLGATFAVAAAMAGTGVLNGFGNVLTITAFQRWVMLDGRMQDPSRRPADSVPVETLLLAHPLAPPTSESDPGDA